MGGEEGDHAVLRHAVPAIKRDMKAAQNDIHRRIVFREGTIIRAIQEAADAAMPCIFDLAHGLLFLCQPFQIGFMQIEAFAGIVAMQGFRP